MGKGQRRRLKRAREAGEEYEKVRLKEEERKEMEDLPDHDLFFLDREDRTSKTKRSRAEKKARLFGPQHAHSLTTPSLHEAKKIAELAKRLEAGGVVDQSLVVTSKTRRRKGKGEQGVAVYDMWDEGEKAGDVEDKKKNGKKRVVYKALAPADLPLSRPKHPGQSYNPTLEDHQDLLKKAVEVEEAREEAIKEAKKPVATTVSETMLAVMVGSSDEEDNEEEEAGEKQGGLTVKKKKGKLTKTERNRLRRRKEQEHLEKQRKAQKSLLKQVEAASQLAKEVTKKAQHTGEDDKAVRHQRPRIKPREAKPVVLPDEVNPIKAKSVEVLLSEEVSGELRLVRPEGDLVKESFDNLKKRGWIEKGATKKTSSARNRPSRRVKYLDKYRG